VTRISPARRWGRRERQSRGSASASGLAQTRVQPIPTRLYDRQVPAGGPLASQAGHWEPEGMTLMMKSFFLNGMQVFNLLVGGDSGPY